MKPLRIVLGDLNFLNKYTRPSTYTPQNVGYIAAYAKRIFGRDVNIMIFKDAHRLLEHAKNEKPDVVALSLYFWNTSLNKIVVKQLRKMYGQDITLAFGGPSIDIDPKEQMNMFHRFPEVNALIVNEGELGFANLTRSVLSGEGWSKPLDGVIFSRDNVLVKGADVGLSMDLATLDSPYLTGLMDGFMDSIYQPLVQTSRLCPYTCSFCVSGKNKGKLRAFPMEQVKAELNMIAKAFADRPHFTLFIVDENFGILKRDVEIAEHILKCHKEIGWPQNVFFYNDKRFTDTSRQVVGTLGKINSMGLTLSLQTDNPETLKEIKRKNLTSEQIDDAIQWASTQNIPATTEIIFGLPYETKDSFVDTLEQSVQRGFDSVLCYNLFLMDGIEMNREDYRKKHEIKTKFRLLGTNYGYINNEFTAECEEVVVSSKYFSFEDFVFIRCLSFMFYSVFSLSFYKLFFNCIRQLKIPLVKYFYNFINPDLSKPWPKEYLTFVRDFKKAFIDELIETRREAEERAYKIFKENDNQVGEPTRLNVLFGSRLIYEESVWVKEVLKEHLKDFIDLAKGADARDALECTLDICSMERINLKSPKNLEPIELCFDVVNWKKNKFKTSLIGEKMPKKKMTFRLEEKVKNRIESFNKDFKGVEDRQYYYSAFEFIVPRSTLLYQLEYEKTA